MQDRSVPTMKTVRTSELPPFFTQVIGSLPRPQAVRDLLAKRGEFPPDRFRQWLDAYVLFAIRLQESSRVGTAHQFCR